MPLVCCSLAARMLAWGQLSLPETSDAVHLTLQESM